MKKPIVSILFSIMLSACHNSGHGILVEEFKEGVSCFCLMAPDMGLKEENVRAGLHPGYSIRKRDPCGCLIIE